MVRFLSFFLSLLLTVNQGDRLARRGCFRIVSAWVAGTGPWTEVQGNWKEGDSMYDSAFLIGVKHMSLASMALNSRILLKIGCKYRGKLSERLWRMGALG
jgi:hypothetical protein